MEMTQEPGVAIGDVRPLQDRVLLRRGELVGLSPGGLEIPDAAKETPMEGTVVATGDGRVLEDGRKLVLDVKAGDKVVFGRYAGSDLEIGGEKYLILREDEILAVLE